MALAMALTLLLSSTGLSYADGNPGVVPPNSQIFGKSYGQWGAEWWKWAYAQPFAENPVSDPTGALCDRGQSGDVWFLAGNFGGKAKRTCTVPAGKAIFFPIYNIFNDYPCPDPTFQPAPGQSLEDFLTNGTGSIPGARAFIDPADPERDFKVSVDQRRLANLGDYRATSPMVTFTGHISMLAFDPCVTGQPQQGVADGYWIMLEPLSPGQHTLRIEVKTVSPFFGKFHLDVSYDLTIPS
jgi:hypothetical protein